MISDFKGSFSGKYLFKTNSESVDPDLDPSIPPSKLPKPMPANWPIGGSSENASSFMEDMGNPTILDAPNAPNSDPVMPPVAAPIRGIFFFIALPIVGSFFMSL